MYQAHFKVLEGIAFTKAYGSCLLLWEKADVSKYE